MLKRRVVGLLEVDEEDEKGTRFGFYLPSPNRFLLVCKARKKDRRQFRAEGSEQGRDRERRG